MIIQHLRQLTPRNIQASFATQKGRGSEQTQLERMKKMKIQEKYYEKSSKLYSKFMQSQEKVALTLDNYQIHCGLLIERLPIFLPYAQKSFNYYKVLYNYRKKTLGNFTIPKDLRETPKKFLFEDFERQNIDNFPTHRQVVNRHEVYEYSQNSRYWKKSDPSIVDDKKIQTYSSDNVYFIVKKNDKWTFPTTFLPLKHTFNECIKINGKNLFNGTQKAEIYYPSKQPIAIVTEEDDTLERGKGIKTFLFKGLSIRGYPQLPNNEYSDYAWVPKPLLSKYFEEDYFNRVIKSVTHLC